MELINFLAEPGNMCDPGSDTVKLFQFIGKIVTIIKIVVPIIIVIMGSIDLVKAVMAQKDEEIKKAYSTLLKRVIIGVIIFFLPGLVKMVVGLADEKVNETCWKEALGYNEVIDKSNAIEISSVESI